MGREGGQQWDGRQQRGGAIVGGQQCGRLQTPALHTISIDLQNNLS